MFKKDQKICQEWAAESEQVFFDTIMFVSVSIRQQTHQLEQLMLEFQDSGSISQGIWGYKYDTLGYTRENINKMYRYYKDFLLSKTWKGRPENQHETYAMLEFLKIPGIGMAKAGFLSQLLIGKSWCADTNNLSWFNLDPRHFNVTPKTKFMTRCVKIDGYINLGKRLGGSARLWNNWCRQISKKYPSTFETAQDVSSLHWRVHDQMPFD